MAVAHGAVTESHTGTTGSASQASFAWTHTPGATPPRGVLVFTFVNANADDATGVTYGGLALTAVSGGRAIDSAGEPRDCKAWFLGAGVPTGTQTVEVTRNNNANVMYAVAITVSAEWDTKVVGTPAIVQGDGTLAESSVDSGGEVALRYAGLNSALNAVPAVGANSTNLISIDFGTNIAHACRETTAGSGSRAVGFSSGTSDDRAVVHVAITERRVPPLLMARPAA